MRSASLRLDRLEDREVPSVTMLTDMHGIWGSYPLNLTPSGNTLYFSADNGHGYELYASDGTVAGTHEVKQIKPGLGGSNPLDFVSADNGVVYFTADDGTGRALWRSDGTAAGTAKVNLMAAATDFTVAAFETYQPIGLNGNLYFLTVSATTQDVQWWVTNGTTTTLLKDFGPQSLAQFAPYFDTFNGSVTLNSLSGPSYPTYPQLGGGSAYSWVTDGTAAGTVLQQQPLRGTDAAGTEPLQTAQRELPNGRFLQIALHSASAAGIWTSDGIDSSSLQLVQEFGAGTTIGDVAWVGNEMYFAVYAPPPSSGYYSTSATLWVTDGTTSGTHQISLPNSTGDRIDSVLPVSNGVLVTSYQLGTLPYGDTGPIWLVSGTGTVTQVQRPTGVSSAITSAGSFPPGSGAGAGDQVFRNGNQLFVVDATGTATLIDPTTLPSGFNVNNALFIADPDGWGNVQDYGDVYFNGAIYLSAANGAQHAQLWKVDVPAATVVPPVVVAPAVTSVVINDGSAQRSMVTKLTVTFNEVVDLADGAVSVTNANGTPIFLFLDAETVQGKTVLTITFGGTGVIGGSVPDGRYNLTIVAGKVTDAASGPAMASNSVTSFTRLFGDLTGSGTYDRDARWMVHQALGQTIGQPGYIAALDFNGNGVIDATDELAVVRNWGKSV